LTILVEPVAVSWDSVEDARDNVGAVGTTSRNAALFFPHIRRPNPLFVDQTENFAPSGAVAGIFARTDAQRVGFRCYAGRTLEVGRIFAEHLHFPWFRKGPPPWPATATWIGVGTDLNAVTGTVDTSFPKGAAFADWLMAVGASTSLGQIPLTMAQNCRYEAHFREASRLVAEGLGHRNWRLVYQSRSGPPSQPWLGPDVSEALVEIAAGRNATAGVPSSAGDVVVVPIGFVSDHMEVLYDLDDEARTKAAALGLHFVRAGTVGTHPRFVRMIRELVLERMGELPPRWLGDHGPSYDVCEPDCCAPPHRG
jgi:hypothetical protein